MDENITGASKGVKPPETPVEERVWLSPTAVAQYLSCSESYVYCLLADGALPSQKIGRLRRVARRDVDALVERGG